MVKTQLLPASLFHVQVLYIILVTALSAKNFLIYQYGV